ncbi:MAG: hypothetical protein OEW75_02590 [Cyclobacteriaceae bacterium]|nr:hypothetical protein [Cyclobacteriaceae bacterium]
MIKYNPKTWFDLIFHSYSRKVMRVLAPSILFMIIYTTLVCYIVVDYLELGYRSTTAFHSLLGIVLGLVLVFRKNSAYDRWWEGRKQWGALVNSTRNLAFKLNAFLPESEKEVKKYFYIMISNFVFSFKEHLRGKFKKEELEEAEEGFFTEIMKYKHKPNYIISQIYKRLNELYKKEVITGDQFLIIDKEVKLFADIMGACERIKNTPIPYSYSMFIKKFIFTYTITLPFGFVTEFQYFTIPIVVLLFFILVSIELISEEIEEPFGNDVNDLPTDELSEKIKGNLAEVLLM